MKTQISLLKRAILICIIVMTNVLAQNPSDIPTVINYQGYLTDENGKALSGTYDFLFRLYPDTLISSNWDWSEEQRVVVENGLYNVLLGSTNPITADSLKGEKYLGISVNEEKEMETRLRLVSVAYSLRAEEAYNAKTIDNFRIVSGFVASDGTGQGIGFTSENTGTGKYKITFDIPFSSEPNVIVSGKSSVDNWFYVENTFKESVDIYSEDEDSDINKGYLQNANFYFIAIGTR